ncbi:SusC/RagA family TonB-linked outer membrane protein [Labilibaculum antarcticum]|uniref:TonB-dependent receptor plug domain-containing protein n=1 Tax=Labilibaculum antarcticum TaxID=1717717 RepID=A0A1Y1CL45_9BACT|nr:TonB-dependent receptor [Labilibaculum antarcticum]BAX81106.1 hypothetical protein ALGA_2794 [Labilibaculum antarcticum]
MKKNNLIISQRVKWRYLLFTLFVLFTFSFGAQAQELTVKGTVSGAEDGFPIPGVSIVIKGTTIGSITNVDGVYKISANVGDILIFSFIGMTSQEKTVSASFLDVDLATDVIGLQEVVAIGYGTVKKKELTGAVARVKAEDLTRIVTSDVGKALQGQVAGVNVIASSGAPGASSEILIRGLSSIGGSNNPLYVVDGVPFDGDPGLNPNEIETIDILKDAASCAIYGTRGAAGVILVTTKKGKAGSLRVSANASFGIQDIRSSTPVMNAAEQTYFNVVKDRNVSYTADDEIVLNLAKSPKGFLNDTDLGKLVFIDNASVQDYNLNISGGTEQITYNVSTGYHKTEGVIVNSNFERFNTRINTTYKKNKWTIDASAGMTQEDTDSAPGNIILQSIKYYPTQPTVNLEDDASPIYTQGGDEQTRLGSVLESFQNTDEGDRTKVFTSFRINYNLLKGLDFSTRLSYNGTKDYRKKFNPYQEVYDNNGDLKSDPSSSSVHMISSKNRKLDFEAGIKYQKKFKDHKFTVQAVYTMEDQLYDAFFAKKDGVLDNTIDVLDGTSLNAEVGSGTNYTNKQIGTLGRILYDYKSKYMLSVSARYDGSSKFAKDHRWGLFPSVSGAWNISDENFWNPIKNTVNDMKLRIGRGTVGNNRFNSYAYSAGVTNGKDYAFGTDASDILSLGSTQSQFANADIKWETSVQWNAGVDIAMFDNKLTLTAEVYDTRKKDMLFPVTVPGSASGSAGGRPTTVTLNVGDMTNRGFELAMGYRTQTGQVKWGINGTFSTNENEITRMITGSDFILTDDSGLIGGARSSSQITALAEGYEAGAFFIYTTDGIVDTNEKLAKYQQIQPSARMGDLVYEDNNGDGRISEQDRVYQGSGLPKYECGLNFIVDYKGFDFSMQWYAALGHEIMNGAKATAYGWGRHKDLLYAWSEANPETSIPTYRADMKSHENYKGYTDLWLEDGSYVRLKSITVGYSLPNSMLAKLGLSKARVYVSAQNPLTFTKYSGFDPEVGGGIEARGLDKGNYPVTSMYLVGINLNF